APGGVLLGKRSGGGAPGGVSGTGIAVGPGASRARVALAEVTTTGGVERDVADKALRARLATFRFCYQRALERDPTVAGLLEITVEGKATGEVAKATVKGPAALDAARACVQTQVARIHFATASNTTWTMTAKMMMSPDR